MAAPFVTTRRVEFCETDMAGIVHFANFYIYMEQAEHELFRTLGLELFDQQDDGTVISWPRVSASCSFDASARFNDVLEIRLTVARIGAKSLTFSIEFWCEETRIAHGQLKTVCCRFESDKILSSVEIPSEFRQNIEKYAAE